MDLTNVTPQKCFLILLIAAYMKSTPLLINEAYIKQKLPSYAAQL